MSWIRIETSLPRSRKIVQLARELRCNRMAALGVAMTWLAWLDEQTVDGRTGMCAEEVDDVLGFKGVGSALVSIGWAELDEHGALVAVDWEQYNGESAKQRALKARRNERYYKRCNSDACSVGNSDATATEKAPAREEKIREEENTYSTLSPNERGNTRGELQAEGEREGVPTLDEIINVMQSIRYGNMTSKDIRLCAEQWLDTMQSNDWMDARGNPIQKWAPSARVWVRSWATNRAKATRAGGAYKAPKNMNDASEYGTH